jgi:hypothetical protein
LKSYKFLYLSIGGKFKLPLAKGDLHSIVVALILTEAYRSQIDFAGRKLGAQNGFFRQRLLPAILV